MNIGLELMKEHSLRQAKIIASYAISSSKRFAELINCFLSPQYRLSQRAAFTLSHAVDLAPEMIEPYVEPLVSQLHKRDVHVAILRNSLRILERIRIPEVLHGEVIDTCFKFLVDVNAAIAVKAFAMGILDKLSNVYPEILPELKLIIEDKWENETPAFRSRGRKILKKQIDKK